MKTFEKIREAHLAEEEKKEKKGLAGKAEKSGISKSILKGRWKKN